MINQKRLVQTLIDLVKIDSLSGKEENMAKELVKRLKLLGCNVISDNYGNIVAKLSGIGKPFLFNVHMDTVEPGKNIKPKIKGDRVVSDGSTVLGSDPKAGVSVVLEILKSLNEDNKKHFPLEIVFTKEEETTFGGALNLNYKKIKAKHGVVLDGDEQVYNIFVSSPTLFTIDAEIIGRGAHAGVEPEKGISAIEIAAKIITQLKLGRIDKETTINIGLINGGSARNAVPEKVILGGEIRSRNKKTLSKLVVNTKGVFVKVAKLYPKAKVHFKLIKDFEGFKLTKSDEMVVMVSKTMKQMGITPVLKDSGGGSDANVFSQHGIKVVVVGAGYYEAHSTREYLVIPEMVQAALVCEKLITET